MTTPTVAQKSFFARLLPDRELAPKVLRLASPVLFAMLTQTFINITDTYLVGKLDPSVSIPGQAALGYSLPLLWIVGGSLSAISVGTQAITARRYGEGNHEQAGQVLTNSFTISILLGTLFSILAWFACPLMFQLLSSDETVLELGVPYARWRFLGVLSMAATASCKSFFDGIGKTHIHMVAAIVMNLINLVLNIFLVFGVWGFPRMEVAGSGLASLLATYVGLAMMMAWTFFPEYRQKFKFYDFSKLSRSVSWEIGRLSIPSALATLFVMGGVLMFVHIVGLLDEEAIVATLHGSGLYPGMLDAPYAQTQELLMRHTNVPGGALSADWTHAALQNRPAVFSAATKVIFDTLSLCFISALAFGTATATLVSQSLGANNPDLAERYGWESVKIFTSIMMVAGALTVIFPEVALDLISDDLVVIQTGAPGMRLMGALMPVIAVAIICTQALFGAGNSKFVMWVELVLHFTCLAPLAYLFSHFLGWGFLGIWLSATTYIVLLAAIMGWKFWEGKWKTIRV